MHAIAVLRRQRRTRILVAVVVVAFMGWLVLTQVRIPVTVCPLLPREFACIHTTISLWDSLTHSRFVIVSYQ